MSERVEAAPDPRELLRSKEYVRLLVLAALLGVPVSVFAYFFLKLVDALQKLLFTHIPVDWLGFHSTPSWWPIVMLPIGGLLAALAITRLPGKGGHSPADGFKPGGVTPPSHLPSIFLAALATLAFGAVLGPEAPLILMGSGLGALAMRLAAKDAPERALALVAGAGSFAAVSSLLGSPLAGAFLLLEAAGLGGGMVSIVLMPGLVSAGLGALVFVGLDSLTGFGTFSLSLPALPKAGAPTGATLGYAVALGLVLPVIGILIRRGALALRPRVERRMQLSLPLLGVAIGVIAALFDVISGKSYSDVLFSGQNELPGLVSQSASWSVAALLFLMLCKGVAYSFSLSGFRGGPIFPAMFIGGAAGLAASHLPGLPMVPAVAMSIGALACTMLGLPLTSVLLASLLVGSDATNVMPLVIVTVAVSYVASARLERALEQRATAVKPRAVRPHVGRARLSG